MELEHSEKQPGVEFRTSFFTWLELDLGGFPTRLENYFRLSPKYDSEHKNVKSSWKLELENAKVESLNSVKSPESQGTFLGALKLT